MKLSVLTGHIEAENEAALAFRIGGRMIERTVNVGDRVQPGQVLAKLDPQNEVNALRSAEANLAGARGQLTQARNNFERQQRLQQRRRNKPSRIGSSAGGVGNHASPRSMTPKLG